MTTSTTYTAWNDEEFKVEKDLEKNEILMVEIPHQRKPSAYHYMNQADLINAANEMDCVSSGDWCFYAFTAQALIDTFGEADIPTKALAIVTEYGSVVQVNQDWVAPNEANEYEWALDCIGHDLHYSITFKSVTDALAWVDNYDGHGRGTANQVLLNLLKQHGYITLIEDEEDE